MSSPLTHTSHHVGAFAYGAQSSSWRAPRGWCRCSLVGLADPFKKKQRKAHGKSTGAYPNCHTWRSLNRSFNPHFLPTKARNRPLFVRSLADLLTRNVLRLTGHLDQDHMNGDQIVDHWDDRAIARTGGAFPSNGCSDRHRPTSSPLFPSLAGDA